MTSIPASLSAAATTFAPRSWPSRPGLATRTRIGLIEDSKLAAVEQSRQCIREPGSRSVSGDIHLRLRIEDSCGLRTQNPQSEFSVDLIPFEPRATSPTKFASSRDH